MNEPSTTPIFTFEIPERGSTPPITLSPATLEEFSATMQEEHNRWGWLFNANFSDPMLSASNTHFQLDTQIAQVIRHKVLNDFAEVISAIELARTNPAKAARIPKLLKKVYVDRGLPHSRHTDAIFVGSLGIKSPVEGALMLLHMASFEPGIVENKDSPLLARIAARFVLFRNSGDESCAALRRQSEETLADLQNTAASAIATASGLISGLKQSHSTHLEAFNALDAELRSQRDTHIQTLASMNGDLIKTRAVMEETNQRFISQLQAVFTEHMKLKAPVEYWQDKRIEHTNAARQSAIRWFVCLGAYAALAIAMWKWVMPLTGESFYKGLGILLFLALPVLWLQRIQARLWLSNRHLAEDANERVAMCKAFLALATEKDGGKGLVENERIVVLNALFRPSKIGVLKDDAMPITPISIASKGLSG